MQFRTLGTLAQVSQFVSKVCLTLILCTFRFQVLWVFPSLDTRSQLQASQDAGSSGRLQLLSELLGSDVCEYWNGRSPRVRLRHDPPRIVYTRTSVGRWNMGFFKSAQPMP